MAGRGALASTAVLAVIVAVGAAAAPPPVISSIPLCSGLTVVTAISQSDGDYESIKTVESISEKEVAIKYSNERMVQDVLADNKPHLEKSLIHRRVLRDDLDHATLYEQVFYDQMPDEVPGTTAIGTSRAVLTSLAGKGESDLGIFNAMYGKVSGDRNVHPNVFDYQMVAHIKRIEAKDVLLSVVVNDIPALLPAIHAGGDFFGDRTEFWFLDDAANPLTLKYQYGIGSGAGNDINSVLAAMNNQPQRADKDHLDVVKIAFRCQAAAPAQTTAPTGSGGAAPSGAAAAAGAGVEQQLAKTGKAEIYDIYFSFNNADIRPESEPSLKEIADVLAKHPDWKLTVAGHTDNIGGHAFNLGLSQRRAASVKAALASRYHIAQARLSTTGFGDTQPQDNNATLEGRARNRRVELTRQ